ncbi:MAG: cation diffusion facilitator family transporter [Prolixibacteraceae bacterium]|jgi:cobalt-zinc-cadmium efflux system protein|nr:cation diffusion facilitator family transporter [Prolixibacteraceae bacterium]
MGSEQKQHHSHQLNSDELRGKKLLWVTVLNLSITIVQIVGGLISNSLSLLSDALHNLGDSSALFIAFIAGKISRKAPNSSKTFGYKRVEILAALFNAVVLISICIFLFYEAYERLMNPEPIKGKLMFWVAIFGLLANLISVVILNKDKAHNLNVRAAYLHLMGDTLSSVAVILGGVAIWIWGIYWIDPLITVFVGGYIVWHTWGVLKETVEILMQATPDNIDLGEIKNEIEKIDKVKNLHHVHIWKLDDTSIHFEGHVEMTENMDLERATSVREEVEKVLKNRFDIQHITLQMGYRCCDNNHSLIFEEEK